MAVLLKTLIAVLLAFSLLPFSFWLMWEAWSGRSGILPSQDPWWLVGGLAVGILLVLWRRPNALIHTTIHELCHALFCLLLGVRVTSFRVSDGSGGAVGHEQVDPLRGTLISIAPYTLPLLLAIGLLLHWWIASPWLSALVGFLYIHHLHALYYNITLNFWGKQSDLAKVGRPLSAVLISSALFLSTWWTIRMLYY